MATVTRMLTDERTYRRVLFLLSAIPLGPAWFVTLVTVWSLCLGFMITPVAQHARDGRHVTPPLRRPVGARPPH